MTRALVMLCLVGCGAASPPSTARPRTQPMLGPFVSLDARCETTDDPSDPHADPVAPWVDDAEVCPAPLPAEVFEATGTILRAGLVHDTTGDACRIFVELVGGRAWVAAASIPCEGAVTAEIDDAEVTVRVGTSESSCHRDGPEWRCSPWTSR